MFTFFAFIELYHTLADAWRAADLPARLRAWRLVVTDNHPLAPLRPREAADA